MKVYCFASHWDGRAEDFLRSMRHAKQQFVVHMEHQGSWSWDRMVDFELEVSEAHPDDLLIFADLWDSLYVGDPAEMEEQVRELTRDLPLLHTDKHCWPEPEKAEACHARDPHVTSPWRYVNGSGPFGLGRQIAEAIRYGRSKYPIRPLVRGVHPHRFPQNDNDQRFWTDLYLDGLVGIDHECNVVQGLVSLKPGELSYHDGRIHNLITGTRPHILHAADHTWEYIPQEVIDDKSLLPRK